MTAVTVLLGLYNGADHLEAQLDSLRAQTLPPQLIIASDDGSTDDMQAVFRAYAEGWKECEMVLLNGPQAGFAANFLHLIRKCPPSNGLVAFCDQDDVWLKDKLARATAALRGIEGPALYGSTTWITDTSLGNRRRSPEMTVTPGFRHALAQNLAGANTLVLNAEGLELAKSVATRTGQISAHDWWLYQLVAGAGGIVRYDPEPTLLYRQHDGNLMDENKRWDAMKHRLALMAGGTYREWTEINLAAMEAAWSFLTPEARATVTAMRAARKSSLPRRVLEFLKLGLMRQGRVGQLILWVSVIFKRI